MGWLGVLVATSASLVVFANNLYQLGSGHFYLSTLFFIIAFAAAFITRALSSSAFIFLIPLLPTVDLQMQAYFGIHWQSQPGAGFDLAAGMFLGVLSKDLFRFALVPGNRAPVDLALPWPVGASLLVVTLSTILAVIRNSWQSASAASLDGLIFNLLQFRTIGGHDDFRPLTDWVAYGLAGAVVAVLVTSLKDTPERDLLVFRALIAGLIVSVIVAAMQIRLGIGIPAGFITDPLGHAAFGFQPDPHAFAGYMLLGALGLWGYFAVARTRPERLLIALTMLLSWLGLLASLSRATLIIALMVGLVGVAIYLWRTRRERFFLWMFVTLASVLIVGALVTLGYQAGFFPVPRWVVRLIDDLNMLDFSDFREVNRVFSERPGMFLVALRMIKALPLLGIGNGDFYRMSPSFNFDHLEIYISGENTHNYFLQTVAETGLIGGVAFAVALVAPFFLTNNTRVLMPAAVGLFSLCLGNLYAHSFLVRENLMLAAILLALMYAWVAAGESATGRQFKVAAMVEQSQLLALFRKPVLVSVVLAGIAMGAIREAYQSFQRFPFDYGRLCFVPGAPFRDRWITGVHEIPLPAGSHGIRLPLTISRPDLALRPLGAEFQIVHPQRGVLAAAKAEWNAAGPAVMELRLSADAALADGSAKAVLKLSGCWTPINLGFNGDGRRLGVLVDPPVIF